MEYMTLMGAEQVQSAGSTMRHAAEEMQRAASNIAYALEIHHRFMDDWLIRFQDVLGIALHRAAQKDEEKNRG